MAKPIYHLQLSQSSVRYLAEFFTGLSDAFPASEDRMNSIVRSLNDLARETSKEKPVNFSMKEMFDDLRAITIHRMKNFDISFDLLYPDGDP